MAGRGQLRLFEGAVAIVTGGASGIGRALGEGLADRGAHVVLADLQQELAEAAAAAIRARGRDASAAALDVTDARAVDRLVDETRSRHGRLDFMWNNAGIGAGGEVLDQPADSWSRIIDVNVKGVVHGVRAAYRVMAEQGFGHIVNTASMQGLLPGPLLASYATTKHAVVGLSKALRTEAAARGVRVSVLCPGVIRTPILSGGVHGLLLPGIAEDRQREFMRAFFERLRPMDPCRFAARVLRDVARNRAIIIVPSWWRPLWWLDRLSPSFSMWIARKGFESMAREVREVLKPEVGR